MTCVATKEQRRIWCPGKCTGCVHDEQEVFVVLNRKLYSPSAYSVIQECFPDVFDKEVEALCQDINQGAHFDDRINGSQFLHDCLHYLTEHGYSFGCGCSNGCPPGCHC